jgi:hypothetical protein
MMPDVAEWIAGLLWLVPHERSCECICQEIRAIPAIEEAMRRMGKPPEYTQPN